MWDVWFHSQIVYSNIEHLSNIDEWWDYEWRVVSNVTFGNWTNCPDLPLTLWLQEHYNRTFGSDCGIERLFDLVYKASFFSKNEGKRTENCMNKYVHTNIWVGLGTFFVVVSWKLLVNFGFAVNKRGKFTVRNHFCLVVSVDTLLFYQIKP